MPKMIPARFNPGWLGRHQIIEEHGFLLCWMEVKGLYRYGAWAIDPRNRPGHGGYWSSCASAFGRLLGLNLTETCIDEGSS